MQAGVGTKLAAAERNKALLAMRKDEYRSVVALLKELGAARERGQQRVATVVPLFGGAALMPVELVLDGAAAVDAAEAETARRDEFVTTWLGTDLFARTDAATAVRLLETRAADVDDALEEVTRGMAALELRDSKTQQALSELAAAQREKEESGVMDICEPISESEALACMPRPATAQELAALEKAAAEAARAPKDSTRDSQVEAFLAAMEEEEQKWARRRETREAAGKDVDEDADEEEEEKKQAAKAVKALWPAKKAPAVPAAAQGGVEEQQPETPTSSQEEIDEERTRTQQQLRARDMELTAGQPRYEPLLRPNTSSTPAGGSSAACSWMGDKVVEHTDAAETCLCSSDEEEEEEGGSDSDDEGGMPLIKPKNPLSFVSHAMVHTAAPVAEAALRRQLRPLQQEEEEEEEEQMGEEDTVCFAPADGRSALPPVVRTSSSSSRRAAQRP